MKEVCECHMIHEDMVCKIKKTLPKEDTILDLAEFFKVFGDATRVKILCTLLKEEMCVCDIASVIGSTCSATSHQLRILKQAKLVKYRKLGKVVYYSLDDNHVKEIYERGLQHVEEI